MSRPRCGVPDIVVGKRIDFVALEPWDKTELTYQFENFTADLSQDVVKRVIFDAFREWSDVSPLSFREVQDDGDLKLLWGVWDHGDDWPFDTCIFRW